MRSVTFDLAWLPFGKSEDLHSCNRLKFKIAVEWLAVRAPPIDSPYWISPVAKYVKSFNLNAIAAHKALNAIEQIVIITMPERNLLKNN